MYLYVVYPLDPQLSRSRAAWCQELTTKVTEIAQQRGRRGFDRKAAMGEAFHGNIMRFTIYYHILQCIYIYIYIYDMICKNDNIL